MIRLAAIGTASTGKSALLNAVFGTRFAVDTRSGTTGTGQIETGEMGERVIEVIDSPPLEHVFTKQTADAYLMVCDKDLIDVEYQQLTRITRPAALALNKADTYTRSQLRLLLQQIRRRLAGVIPPERVVACSVDPVKITLLQTADGRMLERTMPASPDTAALSPVINDLLTEAEASLRVRTRTLARDTLDTALEWIRQRST